MQFTFYMTPEDEERCIKYLLSQLCYFMPQYWSSYPMPILDDEIPYSKGKADPFRSLMIFRQDLFPEAVAVSEEWKQYWAPGQKYICATRPGFEFTRSCIEGEQLFPGEFRFGATEKSFSPISRWDDSPESHAQDLKKLENFYKACCAFLRKNLNKYMRGWYIGPGVDKFCAASGLSLAPSTHL